MVRTATIGQEVKESDRNDQHCKQLIIQTQTNRTKQKKTVTIICHRQNATETKPGARQDQSHGESVRR